MSKSPLKICFVSLYAYPCLKPGTELPFGGSEVRASIFAKELATRPECDVSFVVRNHDHRPREVMDNIQVHRHSFHGVRPSLLYRLQNRIQTSDAFLIGFPYVRKPSLNPKGWLALGAWFGCRAGRFLRKSFLTPKHLQKLQINSVPVDGIRLMVYDKADADVYCTFGVNEVSAEVALYCQRTNKRCVLMCGSDYDFDPVYSLHSTERSIYGCRGNVAYHAISAASHIITQTEQQAQLLKERHGRESTTIPNPIDLTNTVTPMEDRPFVLWVGKSDTDVKRPLLALEVAKRLPYVRFVMVMSKRDPEIYEQVWREATPNVTLIDSVPLNEIEELFSQAFAFVNTSVFEGFPNTFLQAAKHGVPIVSLNVNPDQFLDRYQCGAMTKGNLDALTNVVRDLYQNLELRQRMGTNARQYVEESHDVRTNSGMLLKAIESTVQTASVEASPSQDLPQAA